MHGLGNDFIIISGAAARLDNPAEVARRLCRRRFSVGADGLVLLLPSTRADLEMQIFNADGSEAEMCGNALRCAVRFLAEKGMVVGGAALTIGTAAGLKEARILPGDQVRVNMGPPILNSLDIPVLGPPRWVIGEEIEAGGEKFCFSAVSMGNPHCVIFLKPDQQVAASVCGPLLEKHPLFPKGVNVELCRVSGPDEVAVSVWERGAGETLACGTGACAVVVAGVLRGILARRVKVCLPGGILNIEWAERGPVFMDGPAELVFEGEIKEGLNSEF
jgi:diaminopimelate epimerase